MKQYAIDVDFRVTKRIYVDAENEEQAEAMVEKKLKENPYEYCMQCDACTDFPITDVNECEEEESFPELRKGLAYVREHLDPADMAIIKAMIDKNYQMHLNPGHGIDDSKVIDLLEEYGDNEDLAEGWWMEYGEIDDILLNL